MDVTALPFLADRALKVIARLDVAKRRKQEEKVRQAKKEEEEAGAHLQAVCLEHALNADGSSSSQRRRKKRKKKKLPRGRSSFGHARRRHRQYYAPGWLRWFCSSHTVSPPFVGRPELHGFISGMDEKGQLC